TMTTMIHGQEATDEALKASQILFGGELEGITEATFSDIINEIPSIVIPKSNLSGDYTLVDLVVEAKLCPSKGQSRKDIAGGGINLNNERQQDPMMTVKAEHLLFERFILLRKGKKNYLLASFE
ncbi:S4 domain-containing protein, partial [Verrucomicrobia bacterium]|nr:S4 domain-containing protein [Verrucomicrobiota bacterium]